LPDAAPVLGVVQLFVADVLGLLREVALHEEDVVDGGRRRGCRRRGGRGARPIGHGGRLRGRRPDGSGRQDEPGRIQDSVFGAVDVLDKQLARLKNTGKL